MSTYHKIFQTVILLCSLCAVGAVSLLVLTPISAENSEQTRMVTRRVNAPFFNGSVDDSRTAVFWFGEVTASDNYADVRIGYTNDELRIVTTVIDRLHYYNDDLANAAVNLENYDAVTVLLDIEQPDATNVPDTSYRFVGGLNAYLFQDDQLWTAAYKGNGTGWEPIPVPFTLNSGWEGGGEPNSGEDGRAWRVIHTIPFSELGLSGAPLPGTFWRLGVIVHDSDLTGTTNPTKTWPENLQVDAPSSYGDLHFGAATYTPPPLPVAGIVEISRTENASYTKDAGVGGGGTCGGTNPDFWNEWGNKNYGGTQTNNVQNQIKLSDWPCFSKMYLEFPIDAIPTNKAIISATLTLDMAANAEPSKATDSFIHAHTITENFSEMGITWNNAPYADENISMTRVEPDDDGNSTWPNALNDFDVTKALVQAYEDDTPFRIALYSSDSDFHSGKYFRTNNVSTDPFAKNSVPRLTVYYANQDGSIPSNFYYVVPSQFTSFDGFNARREDVVVYDDVNDTWQLFYDGSQAGTETAVVSAFSLYGPSSLLLSFNNSIDVPGIGTVEIGDIVMYSIPTGTFSFIFDGSDVGLNNPQTEVIDAITIINGNLAVSTTGNLTQNNFLRASGEDVVMFKNPTFGQNTAGYWEIYFDGSMVGLDDDERNVNGAWFDQSTTKLYVTTEGDFSLAGLQIKSSDLAVCQIITWGAGNTVCATPGSGIHWRAQPVGLNVGIAAAHYTPSGVQPTLIRDLADSE